jgi:peptidoglycan/LPS O-acetylase OafA/YrhL
LRLPGTRLSLLSPQTAASKEKLTVLPERNLDLLRSLGVSCVLVCHLMTTWSVPTLGIASMWAIGQLGVLLFFVHTALVLMASIERYGTDSPDWIRVFYVRRAFRIYPLAAFAIVLVTILRMPSTVPVAGIVAEYQHPSASTLAANFTLTQNLAVRPSVLGVLWSLPVEVQMYAVLPFCYLIASRRGAWPMIGLLLFLMGAWLVVRNGGHTRRLWAVCFGPCFAGGLVAYHLARRGIRPVMPALAWPLVIAACGALFFLLRPGMQTPELGWIPCLLLGAAIPLCKDAKSSWFVGAVHRLCEVSYGVYLLHVPALWLSFVVLRSRPLWAQWLVCVILMVIPPVVAYRFVEQPCIKLGKWLAARRGAHSQPRREGA